MFRAYVSGFRRRLETDRRRTMQNEVYTRGEARVSCDKIETVVVRERGRPRRPQRETDDENIFHGEVISDPIQVLDEVSKQVGAETSSRIVGSKANIAESVPWRHAVPKKEELEPDMLSALLG